MKLLSKTLLSVLTERFPQSDVQPVLQALESIVDIDRLTELHLTAIKTPSLEAFLQTLNASETRSCLRYQCWAKPMTLHFYKNLYRRK